ncbi:BA75_04601T0 [Komagataella pastoris]|uniref:Pescadillo homolog n=1 Tax=Komagataella pastoris TaxID=4922 RepID=A0A1B2JI80_PICPA|nr:BA75_04601T0 [Komagataella pastoris]
MGGTVTRKYKSGSAVDFITRANAIKKLQVSLADFRRLCIFKGIYPREPKNTRQANKGSSAPTTFYYTKEIEYLMHDPILRKFREQKTFAKKLKRLLGRGDLDDAKRLESRRPRYKLDHVIRERYPTFMDSLRDLDDALNMLFLFSNMPANDKVGSNVTKQAEKLCNQWLAYLAKERLVRKVFVSIKGVYYSAIVKGQEIRWLVPFKFPQNIPTEVDLKIMLTFLEFYSTLLTFVLYKLYTDSNLVYPPNIDPTTLKTVGGISTYVLDQKDGAQSLVGDLKDTKQEGTQLSKDELSKALAADNQAEEIDAQEDVEEEKVEEASLDKFEDINKNSGDKLEQPLEFNNATSNLFQNFIFFVGREVPLDILEFLIVSCGGKIVSEVALDVVGASNYDLSKITHQISDRPKISKKVQGRIYIQPQWVFDSINKATLLNESDYAPGETLPPHLSPWGDSGSYDPEGPVAEDDLSSEEEDEEEEVEEGSEEDEDLVAQNELELEAAGKYTDAGKESKKEKEKKEKNTKKKIANEEKEQEEMKKFLISNRKRKVYENIKDEADREEKRQKDLKRKKIQLQKSKNQPKKGDS